MKFLKITSAVFLFFIAIININSCSKSNEDVEKILIGAIFPLTGDAAELGEYSRDGLIMGIENINKNGGVNGKEIEILLQDSQSSIREGVSATNKIFHGNKTPNVVFSQLSGIGIAISEITKHHPIIHFSMSATPEFYSVSNFNVRNYLNTKAISDQAYKYIIENGISEVTIASMISDYSRPIADELEMLLENNNISYNREDFSPEQWNAKNFVLRLRNYNDQLIFLTGYGSMLGNIARELENQRFDGILLVEPTFNLPTNIQIVSNASYRVKLIDIAFGKEFNSKTNKNLMNFTRQYEEKFNKEPKLPAALVYETVNIWAQAYDELEVHDPENFLKYFETKGYFNGVIFDSLSISNRNINFPLTLKEIN